jgi:hypothetical protein
MTEQSNNLVEKNKARETNDKKKRGGKTTARERKTKVKKSLGLGNRVDRPEREREALWIGSMRKQLSPGPRMLTVLGR